MNSRYRETEDQNDEAEEHLKNTKLDFLIVFKTLIRKTSVDPKLLQLKILLPNNQK